MNQSWAKIGMKMFLFVGLILIILNPYTKFGPLGIYAAVFFIIQSIRGTALSYFLCQNLLFMLGLVIIGNYGALVSVINNIQQFNHLYVSVSLILSLVVAVGVWEFCRRARISFDELLKICLAVLLFNSVVILLEFLFSDFRVLLDGFLTQLDFDYSTGFRFRGIASSGGAGLSILVPVGIGITLHLYDRKIIGILKTLMCFLLLVSSCLLIGRTGIIFSVIPFIYYITKNIISAKRFFRASLAIISLIITVTLLYPSLVTVLEEAYGSEFLFYSHQFLLSDELEKEGTTGIVVEYLTVLPFEFPYAFTGFGFYGGSDFIPWTDSGFSRMFLSVGFFLGALYYLLYFKTIWFLSNKKNLNVLLPIIVVLLVAEIKEPLLFSQFSARLFIILAVFSQLDDWNYRCST